MRVEGAQGHAPEDAEDAMGKWVEPAMDARYLCDDGNVRTWGELTRNLEDDVRPRDAEDERWLLWAFGAERVA